MKKILWSGLILLTLFPNNGWTKELVFSAELPASYHKYNFDKPSDVWIGADGDIYVANTGKRCVQRFNPKGELEQEFYGDNEDILSEPIGVAVDSKKNVFVIDAKLNCVFAFNKNGNVFGIWGKDFIGKPSGIAAGVINGNDKVCVADIDKHCVWGFDGKTLSVRKIGEKGTGTEQFLSPADIAFNPNNSMFYVVDTGNHRIQKIYINDTFSYIAPYNSSKLEKIGTLTGITINNNKQDIYIVAKIEKTDGRYEFVYKLDTYGIKNDKWECGGKAGFGVGQFSNIAGLFVNNAGTIIYVVDRDNNCIQKLDNTGKFVGLISNYSFEDGRFNSPVDIAFDSNGNMFVVDKNNHRIAKFDKTGNFIANWGGKSSQLELGNFDSPTGIAIDRGNKDRVLVVDCYNSRIGRFYNNGDSIDSLGALGKGDSNFSYPQDIAIDSSGNIFVVDTANKRIQVLNRNKEFVTKWTVEDSPLDIEVIETAGVKEIYVVCHTAHVIRVYNETGGLIRTIGEQGSDVEAGQFRFPCGIARDSSMRIYVLDRGNNCLHIMDRFGKNLGIWRWQTGMDSGEMSLPEGIAIDADDNIYIADTGNHRIQRFQPFNFVPRGGLVGTVTNQGTPVHNARVDVRQQETEKTVNTAYTDSYGKYTINEVPLGTYSVVISKDGYQTGYVRQAVSIKPNNVIALEEVVLVSMISSEVDLHNYPNPFDPTDGDRVGSGTISTDGTIIYYNLPQEAKKLYLEIYNLAGELIWEYEAKNADCTTGRHDIPWTGKSKDGNIVADGVYFCVLTVDDRVETCKMAVKK
ncbi:SMP-30/gluconolactonase/LRE family protein [Candidatus Desantisbacteria bacterium]|nr:SMP-30/gluconolactonase/LRE family protein [Candidatus Desantisbacteria bacterium]